MNNIKYILQGFGYEDLPDFSTTVFKIFYLSNFYKVSLPLILTFGTLSEFSEKFIGVNLICVIAFTLLCVVEFQTGVKASLKIKKDRVESRKIGRMIVKIFVYLLLLFILNSFASSTKYQLAGFEISPFGWLYFIVFSWIVFQMFISCLENLSTLGYHEVRGIRGVILRKFNKWFEFDGTKDADNFKS